MYMAVSHEAKKQHVRASSGLHDHYSELFTQIRVENESDDETIWVTWITFLMVKWISSAN